MAILLTLATVLILMSMQSIAAAADKWDGTTTDTTWYTSNPTATSFTISTAAQLAGLASIVNAETDNFSGDTINLAANIDLDNRAWTPISFGKSYPHQFSGTFEGNGHTISNLSFGTSASPKTTSGGAGLFESIFGTTLRNIGIINANFFLNRTYDNSGALVAVVTGDLSHISSITNCYATCSVTDTGKGGVVGGLIGQLSFGTVTKCYTAGSVKGGADAVVGGLVASVNESGTVTSCYSTASASVGTGTYACAGGLIGWMSNASAAVSNCYATGNIVCGNDTYLGGLVGDYNFGTILGCFYNGSATQSSSGVALTVKGAGDLPDTTTMKTSAQMKGIGYDFVADLNNGYGGTWAVDASTLNQGYPILAGVTPVSPSLYKITYDGNSNTGGAAPMDTGAYYSGTSVTLAANKGSLARTNYTFGGWNTSSDGTGATYTECATYTLTANRTLYAKWLPLSGSPTTTISSAAASTTNLSSIPVTITFSNVVTGFTIDDITVTNATKSNFSGSGTTYTVDIKPIADGAVTIGVAAGVAKDLSNQDNLAATTLTRTYDGTVPSVTITSDAGAVTKDSPIPVKIKFSEAVTGFDVNDISVTNGTKGAITGSVSSYTINITPTGQGAVKVNIAAGAAQDTAGNGNTAATEFSIVFDTVSPSVSITSTAPNATNTAPIPVTITFSENVTGYSITYIAVTNSTKSNFVAVSGMIYTVDITPNDQGLVTIQVYENVVSDAAGNINTLSPLLTRTYDTFAPAAPSAPDLAAASDLGLSDTDNITSNTTPTFTGTAEAGSTVTLYDTNGTTVIGTTTATEGTWSITAATLAAGTHTITAKSTDAAGNTSEATVRLSITIDLTRPTASIIVADADLKAGETSLVTITFSEAVTGLTNADLTIANGSMSDVSSEDGGKTYTATFTPMADIEDATNVITLDQAGVADAAGNAGAGTVDSNNYAMNTKRPTASIVVADADLKAGETSLVTITFSEAVIDFTNADLTFANGSMSAVSSGDGGITYTATFTPTADIEDATNVITLDQAGVANAAGNAGTGTVDSNNYAIDTRQPTETPTIAGKPAAKDTSISGTATPGANIVLSLNGEEKPAVTADAIEGIWTVEGLTLASGDTISVTAQVTGKTISKAATVTVTDAIDECFIATAAFGSKFDWPVRILRHFRDQYLLTNGPGTAFVNFYYKNSPPIAAIIAANQPLRMLVRVLLAPVIAGVYLLYHPMMLVVLLILLIAFVTIRRKRLLRACA